jgi:N-methylhydantoinase A
LVAFGGAGGLHASELALALDIPGVLLPAMPGAVSAYGILTGDVIKDYSRTSVWAMAGKPPLAKLRREYAVLEQRARNEFRGEGWSGKLLLEPSADLRYRGQGFELNVGFSSRVIEEFHQQHQFRYGYQHPDREVELVTLRLRARLSTKQSRVSARAPKAPAPPEKPQTQPVRFDGRSLKTNIYRRETLAVGKNLPGPAIVTEYSATTVIPPGARFRLDQGGNLLIEFAPKKRRPG